MSDHADLIFVGGRVHTVNAANDVVPALAVGGGRVLLAGADADVRALAGPSARVVELRGRSLLPGFVDGHCHLASLGMATTSIDCKADGMQSIRALQEAVRRRVASQPPGTWIRGRGYDQSRLAEKRHPNRLDWDAVAPAHPVIFTRTCGHIASVNGRALALAGITDGTPDPPGGRYDRDGGRNLGVAYETAQTPLQVAALPSPDEFREALLRADHAYVAAGATSVHDAGGLVGPAFGPCQDLAAAGRLSLRIYAFATVNSRQHPLMGLLGTGVHTGLGDARLQLGAFKVMTDGSSSGPTAATRDPYTSNCQDCGILYWSQEDLDDLIGQAHRQGFQCTVHAVGVPVVGSSDAPVTHYAPLFGIEQALTRATSGGQVCGPDERVDLTTAIRMHTINGAFASFEERLKGSLEPGKLADLVLLADDIARVPVKDLRHLPVVMTVVEGRVVHEA